MYKYHNFKANSLPDVRNGKCDGKSNYETVGKINRDKHNNEYQRISTQIQAGNSVAMVNEQTNEDTSKRKHVIRIHKETPEMPRYVKLPVPEKYQPDKLHEDSLYQDLPLEIDPYDELPDSPTPLILQKQFQTDVSDTYEKLVIEVCGIRINLDVFAIKLI